jgi:thymidylate synthase
MLIQAETRDEAWVHATEYLIGNGETLNMILEVIRPELGGKLSLTLKKQLDELYAEENQLSVNSVAETIFPAWQYKHNGTRGVYDYYLAEYKEWKKRMPQMWGTYAYRLIAKYNNANERINPLETMITKLRKTQDGDSPKYSSCYELSVYDTISDMKRLRNLACLMHLSFKLVDGDLNLTALYRNHDYRYKVPGNLLGLARLQAFVANEVDLNIGNLVIHSTRAYLESGKGKKVLSKILDKARSSADE